MINNDPFDLWHMASLEKSAIGPEIRAELDAHARQELDRLSEFLDHPPARPSFWKVRTAIVPLGFGLPADQVLRAQELYRRMVAMGGSGSQHAQESILQRIATTGDARSIPFWIELVDLVSPRDRFGPRRHLLAVAALSQLAHTGEAQAASALRDLARHPKPDIRALAVYYLGRGYAESEQSMPPDLVALLSEIAWHDPAFEPRWGARAMLFDTDHPVPMDNPGGVYAFQVTYKGRPGLWRTIELKSKQTLENLHSAIQDALDWDDDHLYAFYLNGVDRDDRFMVVSAFDEDGPRWANDMAIGELGLTLNHKFLYLFDYGDSHKFDIQVIRIDAKAQRGSYPRVVASKGKMEQYPSWAEE